MAPSSHEVARQPVTGTPACLVIDDEEGVCRFLTAALHGVGIETASIPGAGEIDAALAKRLPDLIFLDAALGPSDAVEAIRALARAGYGGPVQLMSGRPAHLIEDLRLIGESRGLTMRPSLAKPFRLAQILDVVRSVGLAGETTDDETVDIDPNFEPGWLSFRYRPQLDPRIMQVAAWNGELHVSVPSVGVPALVSLTGRRTGVEVSALLRSFARMAAGDAEPVVARGLPVAVTFRVGLPQLGDVPLALLAQQCGLANSQPNRFSFKIEIGEDDVVRDTALASEVAVQLRLQGIEVGVGAAGTRYVSIVGHQRLPVSEVRLHRKFVDGCAQERNRQRTEKIVDIIHRAGSAVLADGVAQQADLEFLGRIGCERCQGPAVGPFARPQELGPVPKRRTDPRPFPFQDLTPKVSIRI